MKKISIFIFILFLFSCGLGPINRRGFNVYEKPITNSKSIRIKTNGVYVSISNKDGKRGFYLYKNGLYHSEYFGDNFWNSPQKALSKRKPYYNLSKNFGQFQIYDDTINIQNFYSNNNEFFRKQLIHYRGLILNDSTIKILSWFGNDNVEILTEPMIYRFYKSSDKPDSTKAWFLNKKWYQKNVHESRKKL